MNTFKYKIDGKTYGVEIEKVEKNIATLKVNGEGFSVELEREAGQTTEKAEEEQPEPEPEPTVSAANIDTKTATKAPLPGIITAVSVAVGQKVKAGDTLVVLEAMKMANNIEAEKDGTVTHILVKQGENVLQDTPLVIVE